MSHRFKVRGRISIGMTVLTVLLAVLLEMTDLSSSAWAKSSVYYRFANESNAGLKIEENGDYELELAPVEAEDQIIRGHGLQMIQLPEKSNAEIRNTDPIPSFLKLDQRLLPENERSFIYYRDAEGGHVAFQNGTVARIALPDWEEFSAKVIVIEGLQYVLESFLKKEDGGGVTYLQNVGFSSSIELSRGFYPKLHLQNPAVQMIRGVLQIDGIIDHFDFSQVKQVLKFSYKDVEFELTNSPLNGLSVVRVRDQKRVVLSDLCHTFEVFKDFTIEEGMLRFPLLPYSVDLDQFNAEVRRSSRRTTPEVIKDSQDRPIDVEKYVLEGYKDLVADSLLNPQKYKETIDPETLDQMAESLREGKSIVLLGKAGTGKSSAVRAFAREVGLGHVLGVPRNTRIFEVSPYSLASGTSFTGMIEQRMGTIIAAAQKMGWIFYFDELHSLSGVGTHQTQSNDVTQSIKGPMEKGELVLIGTDTHAEYYGTFGKDPAFNQRLAKIQIDAPVGHGLLQILQAFVQDAQHPIPSDAVLGEAVQLSGDYDLMGAQPRAAINLLKQAQSRMETLRLDDEPLTSSVLLEAASRKYKLDPSFYNRSKALERLQGLRKKLDSKLIGQKRAKKAVVGLWEMKLSNVGSKKKVNSILFVGPPGVGKTRIAEVSAESMGYQKTTIEMNRYSSGDVEEFRREIYSALLRNPFQVFILDEFEKAHLTVQEGALSILQSGEFTVNEKRSGGGFVSHEISARHCLFFLTSNAGSESIEHNDFYGLSQQKELKRILAQSGISRAILSRIRQVVPMSYPTRDEFKLGLSSAIDRTLKRESEKNKVRFILADREQVLEKLAQFYQPQSCDFRDIEDLMIGLEKEIAKRILYGETAPSEETEIQIQWKIEKSRSTHQIWNSMYQ